MDRFLVSVIIPTYNRKAWLGQLLESLGRQNGMAGRFEVIVVDDGSTDGTEAVAAQGFPFPLRYVWQSNQGDAAARNTGTQHSAAELLVFLDDDILVSPDFLFHLVDAHGCYPNSIIVGAAHVWLKQEGPDENVWPDPPSEPIPPVVPLPFPEMCSNNMSLRRESYLDIGWMSNLGYSGSSIWCDVDFAYRAHEQGILFFRSTKAVCWHRDYVSLNLENRTGREREAAFRSVALFQKHPGLISHLQMFDDKTPVDWGHDSPRLIARKTVRKMASTRPSLWGMKELAGILERTGLAPDLQRALSRWVVGGYIRQGYHDGLRSHKATKE
jgi:glycosyltransferase involved in cell wall biosynthesis